MVLPRAVAEMIFDMRYGRDFSRVSDLTIRCLALQMSLLSFLLASQTPIFSDCTPGLPLGTRSFFGSTI